MASLERDELEDSFEIEISQIAGASSYPPIRLWRARMLDVRASVAERRRRYTRVATLVAVLSLILINVLNLTELFPAGLPFVSTSLSGNALTARASGYSWFALRSRPLKIPRLAQGLPCPVTPLTQLRLQLGTVMGIGNSAVFVTTQNMDADGVQRPVRSRFFHLADTYRGEVVTWYVRFPDVEPVLIRGAQLDGNDILLFDGGIGQSNFDRNLLGGRTMPQLLISSTPEHGTPVASWTSVTRIRSSGCYAYQVDTPTKTIVLVFKAVVEP